MHVLATGACTHYNRRRITSVAHTHILLGSFARGLQCCYYGSWQTKGDIISEILFFCGSVIIFKYNMYITWLNTEK